MKHVAVLAAGVVAAACAYAKPNAPVEAQSAQSTPAAARTAVARAQFASDGKVARPTNWRRWVFVGTPLTPNGLNNGSAPFPEFHNVYVEPGAFDAYMATGKWPEGTQIAKELVLVRQNNNENIGATSEVSGRGYFQGEFQGLELAVKDTSRFATEPGGWAYFSFGHQPQPYAASAGAFPTEACNSCHETNAETDFVFTQFYPVLRDRK